MANPPRMLLPPTAMPWGRWAQNENEDAARSIQVIQSDGSSAGSQFAARADILAGQIAGVNNVATMYTTRIPPFTRSNPAGGFSDPSPMHESPTVTFTPPKPKGVYRVVIIVNMDATVIAGSSTMDFTYLYLMVGSRVFRQSPLEENQAYSSGTNLRKTASLAAWEQVSDGAPTTVKFALEMSPFTAATTSFESCTVTAVYIGGL